MPSRRDAVRMTEVELRAYLETQRRIILVTTGKDGLPHPVPMNYGLDDEGRVILTAFAKSQKVRNLERTARAALLVESGDTYGELKSAILWADAEILRDPEEVARLMPLVRAGDAMAGSIEGAMSDQVRASIAKRVVLRFTPFRTASWDHAKIVGFY